MMSSGLFIVLNSAVTAPLPLKVGRYYLLSKQQGLAKAYQSNKSLNSAGPLLTSSHPMLVRFMIQKLMLLIRIILLPICFDCGVLLMTVGVK